ncbi:MAG TPA: N-acetylmuramoyl-L-alanine amidase [Burkholderiales bacterium]|nr:N-acetylmuramoyl-L-alanine amidase [Burkholderiales bacterium]
MLKPYRIAPSQWGAVLIALGCAACAPLPPQPRAPQTPQVQRPQQPQQMTSAPVEQRASPNFDARRPNFVIIHHTTNATVEESLRTLTDPARRVSAHYLIARDGRIIQLVEEAARAWHAGESFWAGHNDINSSSIGIELDNTGRETFPEAQIGALVTLLADLKARYKIPAANFIGHADIAPGRKVDPSRFFPWKRLADEGYGLWCDPPFPAVPAEVDTETLLQAYGYNVWRVEAAVSAFKLHFVPDDPSPQMSGRDRSMLYCLVLQKRALAAQ